MLKEILMHMAKPRIVPVYNAKKPGEGKTICKKFFAEEEDKVNNLKLKAQKFRAKVAALILKKKPGSQIEADFNIFPTMELTKVLNFNYI